VLLPSTVCAVSKATLLRLAGVLQDKLINAWARFPDLNLWAYRDRRQHAARPSWRVLERLDKKAQPAAADALRQHSIELC
jgi:hypothetical protein